MLGGETKEADLTRINLASIIVDAQKVYIPALVEYEESSIGESNGLININTANSSKLQELTGIGSSMAERIIEYREANGYFTSIEDIMNVSGIGQNKFNSIKDDITI